MGFMAGPASQLMVFTNTQNLQYWHYRSDTVNSKSYYYESKMWTTADHGKMIPSMKDATTVPERHK